MMATLHSLNVGLPKDVAWNGNGPLITFARSGLSVPWSDQQSSLLDLADACDVPTR